ncbi:secreted RxLR effector protein 161-like [Humulus lupulus]|uniref:secreted RxLR effector protein 161-like n=1 Tax=Humulus lupulus TaxID=3486 RepID=UPI002B40639E|nr:secreted RxLR effector protein 161-like [Humulus lupulus]
MTDAKITKQPITHQFQLSKNQSPTSKEDIEYMSNIPYSNAVGLIMYLMVCTQPDLAHVMSLLSKYMANPGKEHWEAMKWTLRYLVGMTKVGLIYRRQNSTTDLEGYCDADYAWDRDSRRSTSAYLFLIGGNCVSWKVQIQPAVVLSTTESKYIVVTEAIKEALWLRGLLEEVTGYKKTPTVYSDSQSCIHLCKNPFFHDKTKHVEIKYYFIRDKVTEGHVSILKVPTEENPSDMGTKVVTLHKFKLCMNFLGVEYGG